MITLDTRTDFGKRVEKQLQDEAVIWLTTVRSDYVPQTSPVWFWWDGETFVIYSRPDKPKLRNMAQNPVVTLHFNSDHGGHEVAIFTGTAVVEQITLPPAPYLDKYRDGIVRLGMTPESFSNVFSVPIRITPTGLRGH